MTGQSSGHVGVRWAYAFCVFLFLWYDYYFYDMTRKLAYANIRLSIDSVDKIETHVHTHTNKTEIRHYSYNEYLFILKQL